MTSVAEMQRGHNFHHKNSLISVRAKFKRKLFMNYEGECNV